MANVVDKKELFSSVADAEGDMRKVFDLALILHDYLSDAAAIGPERQGALCHLSCELVAVGGRLGDHCDRLYKLAGANNA